jgi:PAS domain S-box-containing protein
VTTAAPGALLVFMGDSNGVDFRKLVDLATEPMVVHDGTLIVYANRAAADLVGAPDEAALLGEPILRFVAPEDQPSVRVRARELLLRGGALAGNERAFVRLDGSRVDVETTGVALGGGQTLVVVRDVSRRLAAERAAREAELRLHSFFEGSADAIGIARDGRYVFVNAALASLFGYGSPAELVGQPLAIVTSLSERDRVAGQLRERVSDAGAPAVYRTRGLRRDGTEFDLEVRATPFNEGESAVTMAILRDVSVESAAEAKLQASERRFRELFEFVPVSLWEVDASEIRAALDRVRADGNDLRAWVASHPEELGRLVRSFKLVSLNAYGCQLAGGSSKEEVLANLDKVEIPEAAARYAEVGLQLLEGRAIARAEGWGGTVGGDRRWIETAVTALPGHEATWGRLLFASIDVTDRRRGEEERAALHERLRQAEKLEAVGRLAGGIAHDFNNILSGILGYAELSLLAAERGTDLHDHQERIREAALRARALIRQILTFSQRERPNQRIVDVPTVVKEALGLMRAGVPSTATLEARIDQDAGATLADPTQVHQIVLNLCSNARDAIGPYGRILVEVVAVAVDGDVGGLPPGEYVRLRVRDDGAGMDAETQTRIFEPYMTTKGPFGGHGLGLPVVHGIVSAAGGAIRVTSAPGQGSTFDVYLPRREEPPPERAHATPGAAGRGERILLVDDDALVRNTHRRLLESLGYSVTTAADGEEALVRFKESPHAFALVLTDHTMPTLSGADLARALLAIRADVPVILCTGYSDQIDDRRARELGVRSLLQKPIDRQTLAAAVQVALTSC